MPNSTEDKVVSDEQMPVSDQGDQSMASSADTPTQLPVAEDAPVQSTEAPKSEPVFAPVSVKPRLEVKSDLSSMFKSLSAKMKSQRQSRFTDITAATASESGLLYSAASPIIASGICATSEASSIHLQNYDEHVLTSSSPLLTGTEHVSTLPAFLPDVNALIPSHLDEHPQDSSHLQFMYRPPLSTDSDNQVGTDLSFKSKANQISWLGLSAGVPSMSVPDISCEVSVSLEPASFPDSPSVPQRSVLSTFQGSMPDVSLHSWFPGTSGAVFDRFSGPSSVQSVRGILRSSCDMPMTVPGQPHLPPMQPAVQREAYLYDSTELVSNQQQAYSSIVSVPNAGLAHHGFLHAEPRPITPLSQNDPVYLASTPRLLVDQQPVQLLVPPRPPLILTSGQPAPLPIAVGAPLAVVQESASVELPRMPMMPLPPQFLMEPAAMPLPVRQPGLMTEQSPVKLPPATLVSLMPRFMSDSSLQTRPTPHIVLQEVPRPSRPPAVVQTPTGEMMLSRQCAISDMAPGQLLPPPVMPTPLLDIQFGPDGRQLPVPKLIHEMPIVQPAGEQQSNANLRLQDTSDQLCCHYPESRMLTNDTRGMLPAEMCDRHFEIQSSPFVAPGQRLEPLQGLSTAPISHLQREPRREMLRTDASPNPASDLHSQELSRSPNINVPVMDHDDFSSHGHVEHHGASFSGSGFSSRLPAPSAVMAPSHICSRSSEGTFQSEYGYRDFTDLTETDFSDHPSGGSLDRLGPPQFAATSKDVYSLQQRPGCTPVRSLLDDDLFDTSPSGSSLTVVRASRRWKDWGSGSSVEMLTVGELKAALRERDEMNQRRMFHRHGKDTAAWSDEPPRKFSKYTQDTGSELREASDSQNDRDIATSDIDASEVITSDLSSDF